MKAFFVRIFVSVSLLVCVTHVVQAQNSVVYDEKGMPRCLVHPTHFNDGLLILWDEQAQYQRPLHVMPLSQLQRLGIKDDFYSHTCSHWRDYARVALSDVFWESQYPQLNPEAQSVIVEGALYSWTDETQHRLAQVRLGGTLYRDEPTATEFLARHPISSFDRKLNHQLTRLYGVGFTAELYQAWVEAKPTNQAFKQEIQRQLVQMATSDATDLAKRLGAYHILVVQGYMQPKENNRLQPLLGELESMGARVSLVDVDTLATVSQNVGRISQRLRHELEQGHRVILMGASKGVPELLASVAQVAQMSPTRGKIEAILNMAGMVDGSFLVDWASDFPQSLFVGGPLEEAARASGLAMTSLDGFYSMSTESLAQQARDYGPKLPKDLPYFNFVGVLTGNGIARDPEILKLQTDLTLARMGQHGANDGYIEYPGTTVSSRWGLTNSVDIVFESSHIITDGYYQGIDLRNFSQRRVVLRAIFHAILDRLSSRE